MLRCPLIAEGYTLRSWGVRYSVDLTAAKHAGDNSATLPLRQLMMR
jgi:hypothetical protein